MPQTEWLRNNKNLFSTIWRLGSPKVLAWMHSGKAIFLGHTQCFVVFSCSGKGKESLWNFSIKAIAFMTALLSGSNYLPKGPPSNTIILGIRITT